MSDLYSEIDDTPHTKHINIFQVKETITSKNEYNAEILQQPQLALQNNQQQLKDESKSEVEVITKSSITDKIPTVEKDVKLEDINQIHFSNQFEPQASPSYLSINSALYIHCKQCLLILSTENKLQTENALYHLMSQPIMQNLLQKQAEYKDHSYTELKCKRCGLLIGCILVDNAKTESSASASAYFIKKKIIVKTNKQMAFSLLGLRSDLLLKMQSLLCSFFDKSTAIIDISKQTKESLEKYAAPKESVDALFILHKIEGRVFLLGNNGFYNSVIREFNRKLQKNIYFILLFKETEEKCTEEYYNEVIDELIHKGGQGDLKAFRDSNRIICINDLVFDKEVGRIKGIFKQIYNSGYCALSDSISNINGKGNGDIESRKLIKSYYCKDSSDDYHEAQIKEDNDGIYNFIEYFHEGRNNLFANCLML